MKRALSPLFQVREAATLIGTTARRLEGWVEQGFIEPRVRGKGKGSRHGFDVANLVEGVILLEIQALVGEKSRYPGGLMFFVRQESKDLGEPLLRGLVNVTAMLKVVQKRGHEPMAFVTTSTIAQEDEMLGTEVREALTHGQAITFLNLYEPMRAILKRLKQTHTVGPLLKELDAHRARLAETR